MFLWIVEIIGLVFTFEEFGMKIKDVSTLFTIQN